MSIRPLDIVKTQDAAQIKHIENQKTHHAEEQISKNFQKEIQHDQYKPTQAAKSDNSEYRYDAKEKGNNQYESSGGNKKKNENEDKKESKEQHKNGGIDILI